MPNHTIFQSMESALKLGLSNFVLYFMVGFDFQGDLSVAQPRVLSRHLLDRHGELLALSS